MNTWLFTVHARYVGLQPRYCVSYCICFQGFFWSGFCFLELIQFVVNT
jgi:hypothetical protein